MALHPVIVLFLNFILLALVASQNEFDKDVELISGKSIDQLSNSSPLDSNYAGRFGNIYNPHVSQCQVLQFVNDVSMFLCLFIVQCVKINADTRTKLASLEYAVG